MTPRTWLNTRVDLGATAIFSLFNVVINQFYLPFALQNGASHTQVGWLAAAPAIGLFFSPFWANWIEKTDNPKPFVIWPNLIGRLVILLPAFIPNAAVYVTTIFLFQLLMGIQAPAYASLVSRMYPSDLRGRLMGYVRMVSGLIMIPLAYLVGLWADRAGTSWPLIAASIAGVISILLFTGIKIRKQPKRLTSAAYSFKDQWNLVRSNRTLAVFFIATSLAGFGNMLSVPIYQIIQVDVLKLNNVEIGYARVAYYIGLLLTFLIAGKMIDRFDIKYTLMCGIGAYAFVPLLYGLWGSFPAVLLGNGIQGIGEAIWDIGVLAFVFRLAPGREAVVFGLHLMLFGFRGSIGPILSTSLSGNVSLTVILVAAAACAWIGTLLFIVGSRKGVVKGQDNPSKLAT